jgi:prephenate dehydrogenase
MAGASPRSAAERPRHTRATPPELIAAMCGGNATAVHRVLHHVLGDLDDFEHALTQRPARKRPRSVAVWLR